MNPLSTVWKAAWIAIAGRSGRESSGAVKATTCLRAEKAGMKRDVARVWIYCSFGAIAWDRRSRRRDNGYFVLRKFRGTGIAHAILRIQRVDEHRDMRSIRRVHRTVVAAC